MTEYPDADFRYLTRADVLAAIADLDVVEVVADGLRAHARGDTVLPPEAYLGWQASDGMAARCLAMPGAVRTDAGWRHGLKVINGSLGNPGRGIARSQGLTMLFDAETARPTVLMEAAHISATRTAAVTVVAARSRGPAEPRVVGLTGCGTLARVHAHLLPDSLPSLSTMVLHDREPARAARPAETLADRADVVVADRAEDCVRDADVVVQVTTTTVGYLRHDWLKPGAVVVNVSLDDVLPDVVSRADLVVVDNWTLVRDDERRLLGGSSARVSWSARTASATRPCRRRRRHGGSTRPSATCSPASPAARARPTSYCASPSACRSSTSPSPPASSSWRPLAGSGNCFPSDFSWRLV